MSFGCGPAGYDVRVRESFSLSAGEFRLCSTMEEFRMPVDLQARVHDKSTWIRRGLHVHNTIIDPGWRGFLTLEISTYRALKIESGMPIAQIVFELLEAPTDKPYDGKYQDQQPGAQAARDE